MADRQTQLLEEILAGQQVIRKEQAKTNQRLDTLEQDVKSLKQGQETLEHGQGALSVAVQNLGATMKEQFDDLRETFTGYMSDTYELHEERITALEEEVGIKPRKH